MLCYLISNCGVQGCDHICTLYWMFSFIEDNTNMYVTVSFSDGRLEVVVPLFVHCLEVLEGSDGDKLPGIFPFRLIYIHHSGREAQ